jgi:hypothetical protein
VQQLLLLMTAAQQQQQCQQGALWDLTAAARPLHQQQQLWLLR